MVLYKGYCRPLGKKVNFTVKDVISMNTKRGIKWRVKGTYEDYNISTFCSKVVAEDLLNKLPLAMDAEIAYTPPSSTYQSEELKPLFSNATKKADEIEAKEETIEVQEQIQENTNAQELDLHSEKLPAKYYKKNGSLDMRYSICREYAAKRAESQNAVELEAPYTPVKPERPSDDYGGGGRYRKKPRRPLGAEEKCDICSESPIYEKDVNIEDYDDPIQVCQSCFDDIFTDKAAESFEADVESVVSELRELGMPEIVFGDDEERIKINGELVYKIESAPMPIRDGRYSQPLFYIDSKDEFGTWYMDNPLQQFSPPIWIRTPKGLIKNTRFHRNKILERKIQRRLQEDYGEYTKKNPFECLCGKRFKNENALKKHQGDKKHPNYHPSHTLFDNELKGPPINNIINPDGITLKEVYLMFPNWDGNYKTWFGRGEMPLQEGFNYFNAESFEAEDMITVTEIDWETDGEDVDLPTTMDVPSDLEEDEIADYLSDQKGWLVNGFVMGAESLRAERVYDKYQVYVINPDRTEDLYGEYESYQDAEADIESDGELDYYIIEKKLSSSPIHKFGAESFEAAYTPEQRLDDYTPEQLTTSSAVTGDFFEDSLKYSYGGIQGAEELPQQETEIVYAEGFPALQNAEAGMVVDNIENYYIKKKEKFMTILVDEPTLFRMAHDLPLFVELFPSEYAGYTNIKFNYIENPDMEQKILSYAITLQDTTEENKEESEYRAGDVRSRLFDVEFDDWAEQEMKTHGDEVSFKDWADEESESHGDEEFMDWAKHEEESHGERYEAEGGRNVSDFEMSNTDRYEIGNEIIALSSALKKAGDWDWKNVKKIGKGIKEGKYERIKKNMADIDFKTRRVLWDRHHNDFYDLFTDKQMRGLAIPWVTDKYKAEISDEKLTKLTEKFTTKIPSFTKGLDYTTCVSCGLEVRVEALEDTQGNILYYFYSCKCGHNDIQDSSYDAEYFEARQERKPRKMCVNCNRQSLAPSASRLGQNICRTCQRRFGLKSKQAEFFEAQPVNISDDMIIDYLKNSHKVIRKYTAPYRFTKNGIAREFKVKETWMANKLRELEKKGLIDGSVMRRTEDSPDGSYSLRKPVKIYKLSGTELNKDLMRADEEYKFVSRIPKSIGIGGKTEIQKNNLEYVFKKANRPLYPREVVELYNRERGAGKQSNFKKGGLSTGKISRLIKSEPKKYYVSRSGLIHYVGESSMKDYIRNLPAKYYAEENMRVVISEEDILKYLQNSHEYIRKYNAPWKFTSYGMAKKFDFAPSSMRNTLLKMERNGLLKSVLKTVEDSPVPTNRKIKIYYLADKRLMN